ncbi:helix-turn-helix domain-containing protein [Vibrio gangliei]|uniref:helix-turn-helix domain-containing protein n=1 Tax=Vibrio gangliei TaxID=2077090 RepID=UPI000D014512|nr:helix-turn-helix domain-containing protein [Vibrio gangliei]
MTFSDLHQYYQTLELDQHVNALLQTGIELNIPFKQPLKLEKDAIYFVVKGSMALVIEDNHLIIGNTIEYMPIGLMEKCCPLAKFSYTAMSDVTLVKLSYQQFSDYFYQQDKAEVLTQILSFMAIFTLDLHSERKKVSSYHTIRSMLFRYIYRTESHEHENEGIASFIISRTNLSRAHVFRVLADLKQGGYITIKKGRLISINKNLPSDY